jgi:ADP-ribose pyrophosphatase
MPRRVPELASEKVLSSKIIYEGRILKLRVDTVETVDGRKSTREIIEHDECVAVIPVDAHDNVLLVKQYRRALDKELLEIPAGGIDNGDAEAAVIREMQEEIGYRPEKIKRLGGFYSTPGYCNEYLILYLATDLVPSRLHAEDTAGIEVVRVPVSQIASLATSDKIEDAKTITGLLFYLEYLRTC